MADAMMKLTRRHFVATAAGLSFSVALVRAREASASEPAATVSLNAFVRIGVDDVVTVIAPAAEMGQGTSTALPLILAEELDADWSRVRTEIAPPLPALYGNPHPVLAGGQASLGSLAVAGYYLPLRFAGAQARLLLMTSAAQHWNVPLAQVTTGSGRIVHAASGRSLSYGQVAAFVKVPSSLPQVGPDDLKPASQFRLIGRPDLGRDDVPSKTTGRAQYGIDVRVPDMVYATVIEAPADGLGPSTSLRTMRSGCTASRMSCRCRSAWSSSATVTRRS